MAECQHKIWMATTGIDREGMVTERCQGCGVTRKAWGSWERMEDAGLIQTNFKTEGDVAMARKQYGYYNTHKEEILKDLGTMGEEKCRKKWHVKPSTWLSCKERWKILEFGPKVEQPAEVTTSGGVLQMVEDIGKGITSELMKVKKVKARPSIGLSLPFVPMPAPRDKVLELVRLLADQAPASTVQAKVTEVQSYMTILTAELTMAQNFLNVTCQTFNLVDSEIRRSEVVTAMNVCQKENTKGKKCGGAVVEGSHGPVCLMCGDRPGKQTRVATEAELAAAVEKQNAACTHHFIINKGIGVCKLCGEERQYDNSNGGPFVLLKAGHPVPPLNKVDHAAAPLKAAGDPPGDPDPPAGEKQWPVQTVGAAAAPSTPPPPIFEHITRAEVPHDVGQAVLHIPIGVGGGMRKKFYIDHKEDILKDLDILGIEATRVRWRMQARTLKHWIAKWEWAPPGSVWAAAVAPEAKPAKKSPWAYQQYYIKHRDEILEDVKDQGREFVVRKWGMKSDTLARFIQKWDKPAPGPTKKIEERKPIWVLASKEEILKLCKLIGDGATLEVTKAKIEEVEVYFQTLDAEIDAAQDCLRSMRGIFKLEG